MIFFLLLFPIVAIWLILRFGLSGTKNPPKEPPAGTEFTHDEPGWWHNRK